MDLSSYQRLRLRIHLWRCTSCRHYKQNLEVMRTLIRNYCAAHKQVDSYAWRLSDEARERMKRMIREKMQEELGFEDKDQAELRSLDPANMRQFKDRAVMLECPQNVSKLYMRSVSSQTH